MDFTITPDGAGADMSFTPSPGLFNNIWISLEIPLGAWWFNPSFGLKTRKRMKNTTATASLLQQDCKAALQWLLDNGRAASVVVTTSPDPEDITRLEMLCMVTAANGETVAYSKFIQVV